MHECIRELPATEGKMKDCLKQNSTGGHPKCQPVVRRYLDVLKGAAKFATSASSDCCSRQQTSVQYPEFPFAVSKWGNHDPAVRGNDSCS